MAKKAKCMADGGIIGSDGMTDAQRAKRNAVLQNLGMSTEPVAQTAPTTVTQPASQPTAQQSGSMIQRAAGILGGRREQIDKAAGYARGGIVRGKGSPTSDDVPMNISGKNVNLSNMEAVLPHKTVMALGGPEAVERLIQATNGKPPVKSGLREGGEYASGLLYTNNGEEDEYTRAMQATRNSIASAIGPSTNGSAAKPIDTSSGPTVSDGAGGVYTPERGINPFAGIAGVFKDSAQAARGDKSYAQIRAERDSNQPQATTTQQPFKTPSEFDQKMTDVVVPGNQFMTGANRGEFPTSAQGGFTQGNKSYNVNDTSQQGITRVTAPGASPLYTNINPEQAVAGLKNQSISSDAEGIARMANANKIRGEMIANRDKDIPAGGYGPGILGDGGIAADNAEKTQRWRNDELLRMAKNGNQAAVASLFNADGQRDVATMGNETSRQNAGIAAQVANNRDQVTMRGQDMTYGIDAPLKLAQAEGVAQTTRASSILSGLQEKAIAGDEKARETLRALSGKATDYKDRYSIVKGEESIDPVTMQKTVGPSMRIDNATGEVTEIRPTNAQQAGAPKVGEVRGGFKFNGGNPADKANWEKV